MATNEERPDRHGPVPFSQNSRTVRGAAGEFPDRVPRGGGMNSVESCPSSTRGAARQLATPARGRLRTLELGGELDEPDAIEALAPLVLREIHYRLLTSDQAWRLRQLTSVGSQSHLVARAIDWLKANYASPLRVEELAARVHMSPSSLHHHFRQLTAMSPLQYQKWLRLNEARRLMLNMGFDAARAAFEVGYESPSQFSREYARLFGAPPKRDVVSLRSKAAPARRASA